VNTGGCGRRVHVIILIYRPHDRNFALIAVFAKSRTEYRTSTRAGKRWYNIGLISIGNCRIIILNDDLMHGRGTNGNPKR